MDPRGDIAMQVEENAFRLFFSSERAGTAHLGGASTYSGSSCPACDRPMFVYLSLLVQDPEVAERLNFEIGQRIEVLFCPRCESSWGDVRYRLHPSSQSVEMLEFCPDQDEVEGLPIGLHGDTLPRRAVDLVRLPTWVQEIFAKHGGTTEATKAEKLSVAVEFGETDGQDPNFYPMLHVQCQLFGFPCFGSNVHVPKSSLGSPMQFLATFWWNPRGFVPILPPDVHLWVWYEPSTREVVLYTLI